ncbi:magnesium/cobalt transporter CorA [Tenacibaculum piscium]|uniref:magnesium/cobalt transporter CorA n=1 Tax=Tenacibaculum piscium TaxID=1458515 RepID=UPI00187B20E5|nr:magnesium/cobalt transporter CorA [Tenacibaculum piscium]MBE7690108.1 magnesium/cobalt transporter CorA [Tenacibaculum piscium]
MARIIKKKKQDIGLSPDELIFRGEQKTEEILFRVIDFDAQNLTENTTKKVKDLSELQHSDSVTWLNLDGLHNMAVMQEISSVFKFSPLVMAEVLNTDARPRVIEYENCTLISIKMLMLNEKNGKTTVENLSLILTEKLLFSFQEQKGDVFEPVRERIKKQKKRIRTAGTDYLTFALLDIVVDNYLYVLGFLGDKIETLEENLLINPTQNIITEINNYKRELNFLRKNIKPAKEMIFSLAKTDTDFIKENTYIYFKELEDNISQANDATDNYREILSDQLNIYHTTISSKLNDIMRFLTIFSVIFIPLTFIAGIYGTNFEYIPELSYKYSYFIMWGIMLVTAIAMLLFFKNKKWF